MTKTKRIFIRVSEDEYKTIKYFSKSHKSVSALMLGAVRMVIKYHKVLIQAEKLQRDGIKISAMEVKA